MNHPEKKNLDEPAPPHNRAWQIIKSTVAAAFGVQSEANRQKDFDSRNGVYIYIASGIIFTVLFVFGVAWIVRMVLASAAA
ncbi:MAG: DUF2970 domain-containing protein [Gammaproteobacteria bacterium]|nr:DUF2970 domain-containing protein [Gammaproteobacteria bacterium]MBT8150002.1 DUF2970 domain-containing protein [Gammaproteobacteria bacterium]NND39748.1 DUF2970 domain-containing protein [Pseudomonadales bacterium]NNM10544.1 DUF2970 domain-containing protein [Pseudomonadales bacterium]RZV50018.1 MAG: DUF2970 domain-containing protein [Pseudomonadales bacterium]